MLKAVTVAVKFDATLSVGEVLHDLNALRVEWSGATRRTIFERIQRREFETSALDTAVKGSIAGTGSQVDEFPVGEIR